MERQSDLSLRQGDSIAHVHMDVVNKETMDQYLSEKARKAKETEEKARKAEEKACKAEISESSRKYQKGKNWYETKSQTWC